MARMPDARAALLEDPLAACEAYRSVARAIGVLRAAGREPPDLEELARRVGMRPLALQRAFSAWAGVSPKRFAQTLAAARARVALRGRAGVMESALDVGLSGPGRLHDLMVTIEAVTPGEARGRGDGVAFTCGVGPTPFGLAWIATTGRGVHRLAFLESEADAMDRVRELRGEWPRATVREDASASQALLARVFARPATPRPFHLWVRGTNLQVAVWRALLRVPEGALLSYGDVARLVSAPGPVRAVASAIARNPIAWLIPCHRVLRARGDLAGYAWGLDRKAALVGREALDRAASGPGSG
jgi:AraC family transcriptional regulator of adaptative response/methylated-DNA-[protein]-cysteine methyltransferase